MKKTRFSLGGTPDDNVPATRQNISQRTPSGVRPVASPVIPVGSGVQGAMKHGGELKSMKKKSVKKMAFGGPSGPMPVADGGGRQRPLPPGLTGPGGPPRGQGFGGGPGMAPMPAGGGFSTDPNNPTRLQGVDRRTLGPGMGPGMGPGAGGMPIGGGFGGAPGMRYPMGIGSLTTQPGGPVDQGGYAPLPPRAPAMKKGGKVRMAGGGSPTEDIRPKSRKASSRETYLNKLGNINQEAYDDLDRYSDDTPAKAYDAFFGGDGFSLVSRRKERKKMLEDAITSNLQDQGKAARGMKKGGKVSASSYNDMTGGAGGGIGRLEKTSIASKTKSQKLKKGGKVRGYADGGELSLGDRLALERAGVDPYGGTRSDASIAAYRARQDAREKNARAAKTPTPRPKPKSSTKTYGGTERGNGPGPYSRDVAAEANRDMVNRTALIKPGEKMNPDRGIAGMVKWMAGQMPDDRAAAEQRADMVRRTSLYPDEGMKRGGKAKMAKGGKAEAYEGTAKDMAEDKKLAKKRGMSLKDWEASAADEKHDAQRNMKGLKKGGKASAHAKGCNCMACGGMAKYAMGGKVSTSQTGMKTPLRPKPTAMAKGGAVKSGKTFGKPLPGTKTVGPIRSTTATGANMKKNGMKGQLRAKASGAKPTSMMKPLGMTKMASGGKVRGAGIAQRGTKFIGEV